jgi:hypothetical protein
MYILSGRVDNVYNFVILFPRSFAQRHIAGGKQVIDDKPIITNRWAPSANKYKTSKAPASEDQILNT